MSGNRVFQWLVLLILVALTGCSKEEGGGAADFRPNLEVHEAVDISRTGALLEGLPLDLGGSVIVSSAIEFGFMYSESSTVATGDVATMRLKATMDDGGSGNYRVTLTGLTPGKRYYFCMYAMKGTSIVKSDILNFSTVISCAPILAPIIEKEKGETTLRLSSAISDVGGADEDLQMYGMAYREETAEGAFQRVQASEFVDPALKTFEVLIEGLKPGTLYRVFPYAMNKLQGEGRGDTISLSTDALMSATVTTHEISSADIGATWVSVTGTMEENVGYGDVIGCGFLLSMNGGEEKKHRVELPENGGLTTFMKKITGLNASTSCSVRAYVETKVSGVTKIGYGVKKTFTTLAISAPSVSAASYEIDKAKSSMTLTAKVTESNNGTVTSAGFYYSTTNKTPDEKDTHLAGKLSDDGTFSAVIEGLVKNTTYYIRSFARNEAAMGFGAIVPVTPLSVDPPSFNSVEFTLAGTTLTLSSSVRNGNDTPIKERGFCWSTKTQKPLEMTVLKATGNNDKFTAQLPNIEMDVTYYICAYAINDLDMTGYSYVQETMPLHIDVPSIGEAKTTANEDGSLTLSSSVTNANRGTTKAYGFYYSTTNSYPTENDIHVAATGNDSKFTGTIPAESVKANMIYYIRPYADNEKGKGWGGALRIASSPELGDVHSNSWSNTGTSITVSSFIYDVGIGALTERGFCYSTSDNSPTLEEGCSSVVDQTSTDNSIVGELKNLSYSTTYYIRSYAKNRYGTTYSNKEGGLKVTTKSIPSEGDINDPSKKD